MKRTISSFLGLLLVSVPLFASTVKVVSSTANNLTVEVSLPEVKFTEREYPDGNIYTVLRVHGSGIWEIGNPAVPCFGNWILIPNGTSVHITTYPGEPVIYENISLPPVQPPLPDLKDAPIPPFVKNQETYKADRDYPGEFAIIEPVKQMRGQDCTILWIFPYQYNPVSRILRVYPDLRVSIDFKGIARPIPPNLRSRQYERKMLGMAINAKEVLEFQKSLEENEQNKSKSTGAELLIITHDDFETAANTLSDWRTKTGILTRVAKTSAIGNTTTDIESYIDNAIANWSPAPEYLLLLGDAEFVPTWYENLHPWHNTFTGTDIFYADINIPPDYIADLGYGRLPVDTPAEADSLVARIIRYESVANISRYYTHATMAACFKDGDPGNPPDSMADRRFAKTSEDVRNYLNTQGFITERVYATLNWYDQTEIYPKYWNDAWWAVFENDTAGGEIPAYLQKPTFPWDAITADVSNAINNGTFFVLHRNHGWRGGWGSPDFQKWDVDALNNGELRPIVFSINCNTGWFDNETDATADNTAFDDESFIEHWLRHPTGGGIGLIAASRVSWSGINDRLVWGWMDAIWPDFLTWSNDPYGGPERIYTMGGVLNYGKAYMRTKYFFSDVIRATLEGFHWFGDPTMVIWTAIPEMMAVSYPLEVPLGPGNFTVYVENASTLSPVESTWVTVMKGDEVYERGFTDASGNITFSISPSTVGTLWVATRAENYITNLDLALVVCYGDVGPIAIINPPDTVFVDSTYLPEVWIKNLGTDTTPLFNVIYTIDTSGVPVYIDTQSISNIAGGDSALVTFTGWTVPLARKSYKVTVSTFGQFLVDTVPLNDTLEITIQEYNDPPLVAGLPDTNFPEDDTLCIDLTIYVSDSDDSDSELNWSYSIYAKNGPLIASLKKIGTSGSIYVDIDTITHIATIAAAPNWSGTRNIIFTAEDPWGLTDADTMTVTVLSVNDPPVIDSVIPSSPCTILIDSVLSLRVFAHDLEGDSLSYDWSINGVFDTTTIDPVYSYSSSVQVIDTVMVKVSDGILQDSAQWIIVVVDTITGIEEVRDIPDKFVLFAPRPNPSAGIVEIAYGLPERADIGLSIYDIQGRLVDVVYRGKRDAGYHRLKIDSRDLASGIYFIRFQTPKFTQTEKLIVLQ